MCLKCCVCCCSILLILLFISFLMGIIVVPFVFKYSPGLQTSLVLPTDYIIQKSYDVKDYNLNGVNNFYVKTDETENVTLGVWQILPSDIVNEFHKNDEYDYEGILKNEDYNVLIYLHGNAADRTEFTPLYHILRLNFHIFAVDYRGYGDSSRGKMTETKLVADIFAFYKWLRARTKANIFVWGHSLGSAVGTHLVSNLKDSNLTTAGLILEASFTSVPDVVDQMGLMKLFSWLPWYHWTILDSFVDNDIAFETQNYISNVDCPIMILHSKDDTIIPYMIATKLLNIAETNRNVKTHGNITYHLFDEDSGYGHMNIFQAHNLHILVENFMNECLEFGNKKKTNHI